MTAESKEEKQRAANSLLCEFHSGKGDCLIHQGLEQPPLIQSAVRPRINSFDIPRPSVDHTRKDWRTEAPAAVSARPQ